MTKDFAPKDLLHPDIDTLFPPVTDSATLLLGCRRVDYSVSIIARAVEDCNAKVLNLNVTAMEADAAELLVLLRVGVRNADAVVRSLTRYGYDTLAVSDASDTDDGTSRDRALELLHYLQI